MWGMYPHPRIGPIAEALDVSRVTVWRRLKAMQRSGFLEGYELVPHPGLFGVGFRYYSVTIPDPRARARFLDELEFVDGVVWVEVDVGRRVIVIAVSDGPASRARREKMISRIDGVESLSLNYPVWLPPCPPSLVAEEWRFIRAMRRYPTWSLERLAHELGLSVRTTSRRYQALTRERALLGFHIENFGKFPGVVVGTTLTLGAGVDGKSVLQAVERLFPEALEPPSPIRPPGGPRIRPTFIREVPNASGVDEETAQLLAIPGVTRVDTFFPGLCRVYKHWFDERIFEALSKTGVRRGSGRHRPG
jgi:DNA-binding Lrp family transcriptional regulator